MPPTDSIAILTAVARLVSEATSLNDVVARLAELTRDTIPFERMHLLRLDRSDSVQLYSAHATSGIEVVDHRIPGHPGLPGPEHTPRTLPHGPFDDPDARSVMICPLRNGARVVGALWFMSSQTDAFTDVHRQVLDTLGDLVGLAVYHDGVRATESLRRERLDSLERLLQTMAGALDVRSVFADVSAVVRGALPHDMLVMTSWADDGRSVRLHAVSGESVTPEMLAAPIALTDSDQALLNPDPYVVQDVEREIAPASVRGQIFSSFQVRSALRVAIPLPNGVFGSLFFLSHETGRFERDDVDFARRVANGLALALSLEHLAEAARRDAEARETAARLEAQVATLRRELESRDGHRRVIGSSPRWNDVLANAARVARTETTVLLTGESGTGKEVIARFIHHASQRNAGPFVAINCAALPDQLLESELFGHERGAFTGAVAAKPGRIEQAAGGVLFLDEIGEMAAVVQAKLLRVLEEREFVRLGGTRLLRADMRVIAATNRNLQAAIARGEFREDLYYRLGVFEITLPPLRERPEDIQELSQDFLDEIGRSVGRPPAGLSREAREQLLTYTWPGNVRELRNAIERAVILADGGLIRSEHLPFAAAAARQAREAESPLLPPGGLDLDALERSLVTKALRQARHNKTRAAKLLGLTRSQLYSRIEKYGLAELEF